MRVALIVLLVLLSGRSAAVAACAVPKNTAPATAVHAAFVNCAKTQGLGAAAAAFLAPRGLMVVAGEGMSLGAHEAQRTEAAFGAIRTLRMETTGQLASAEGDQWLVWGHWRGTPEAAPDAARDAYTVVWSRSAPGPYRLTAAVFSGRADRPRDVIEAPLSMAAPPSARRNAAVETALTLAEAQFGGLCGASGMAAAFEAQADERLAIARDTSGRVTGKRDVLADAGVASERWRYVPINTWVSASNDFAFVVGRYSMWKTDGAVERGYFTRVWRALPKQNPADSNSWRIIADAAASLSR
jgi:hypothetical protein